MEMFYLYFFESTFYGLSFIFTCILSIPGISSFYPVLGRIAVQHRYF